MFKVTNIVTGAEVNFESKNEVADFISTEGLTDNSIKTIQKKVNSAVKKGDVLYETFKIEEEETMEKIEVAANEVNVNEEELVMSNENPFEETVEEKIEDQTLSEITGDEVELVPDTNPEEQQLVTDETEIPEVVEEIIESDVKVEETNEKPSEEKSDEKPAEEPKKNKRKIGKGIIAYKNGEEFARFPSIKATAEHFKNLLGLGHMPFTPIMKSVRQDIDWNEYSFKHENQEDLHIPASLKSKIEESKKAAETKNEQQTESSEEIKDDEVIEEIVEEIVEEMPAEEITSDETQTEEIQ